jgi:hypothetical protein
MIQTRMFNGKMFQIPLIVMQALEAAGYDLGEIYLMTPKERFEKYLEWEGIIGYAGQVWEAVEESLQTEDKKNG